MIELHAVDDNEVLTAGRMSWSTRSDRAVFANGLCGPCRKAPGRKVVSALCGAGIPTPRRSGRADLTQHPRDKQGSDPAAAQHLDVVPGVEQQCRPQNLGKAGGFPHNRLPVGNG